MRARGNETHSLSHIHTVRRDKAGYEANRGLVHSVRRDKAGYEANGGLVHSLDNDLVSTHFSEVSRTQFYLEDKTNSS